MASEHIEEQVPTTHQEEASQQNLPAWYLRLGEDWWATILGLVLVALIVSRLIAAIP